MDEGADGLADGVAADAELFDQYGLGGDPGPDRPLAVGDQGLQLGDDLVDEGGAGVLRSGMVGPLDSVARNMGTSHV